MFLSETKLSDIVKTQYVFKLKAHFGLFFSLMIVQMFGILFSLGGVGGSSGGSGDNYIFNIVHFSGNLVIILTFLWAFSLSAALQNELQKNMDFTLVSNRISSNLSNIYFIITLSLYGSITASLCTNIIRILFYFLYGSNNISAAGFILPPYYTAINIIVIFIYLIFISSIGYLLGSFIHFRRIYIVFLLLLLAGIMFLSVFIITDKKFSTAVFLKKLFDFYFTGNSLLIFAIKIIITAVIFFSVSMLVSNRSEVRK